MKTVQQKEIFIARARELAAMLLEAEELNNEYIAVDAGNVLTDEDFTGNNAGIEKNTFVSLFGVAIMTPLLTILETTGVKTILQQLKAV
jgi:hypothetical protein